MGFYGEDWDESEFPAAYLITFATYGTWLHGDDRFSVDTHGALNVFGAPRRAGNPNLSAKMTANMKGAPKKLSQQERIIVHRAIEEVCRFREYKLYAVNVRTTHAHSVVAAAVKPEHIADTFKSYATRHLRREGLIDQDERVWSRGRSRRYLWKPEDVTAAIDYVLYCQGDTPFDEWYEMSRPSGHAR